MKLYEEGGMSALELGRRGRRPNEQMKLHGWQCAVVVNLITDNLRVHHGKKVAAGCRKPHPN